MSSEKEISLNRLKAAALNHRSQAVLALAEMLSEYAQLTSILMKQVETLEAKLKAYEERDIKSAGGTVPGAPLASP